jgi:serine carboxypeptidase-like clade 1
MFDRFMIVAVAFLFCSLVSASYEPDRILSLPGWEGDLPSKHYSGYLNVSGTHLHYWFVQSESNPETDPTVVWFNGGPGCSSLDGFVYEQGPFEFARDGSIKGLRPHRWFAFHSLSLNLLFLFCSFQESHCKYGFHRKSSWRRFQLQ